MKIKLLAALAISLLGFPSLCYAEPTARLAQISPTSEGESRLAGLVISMTPKEVEAVVGHPDSRELKMQNLCRAPAGYQVWNYHIPYHLSLVFLGQRLISISVTGAEPDKIPPLIWNGMELPSLQASAGDLWSKLGRPGTIEKESDGEVWTYSLNPPGHVTLGKAGRLRFYFRNGLVTAVLLGE